LDIVEVEPAAQDPAPGLVQLHVGGLLDRALETGLRPEVVDEAGAGGLGDHDELAEQEGARRILHAGDVLAFQLRLDRVHDHDVLEVVDPDVVALLVAQPADRRDRSRLRRGLRHLAGGGPAAERLDDAVGGLDDRRHLPMLAVQENPAFLIERPAAGQNVENGRDRDESRHLAGEREILQTHRILWVESSSWCFQQAALRIHRRAGARRY